jgi:hypothetical protein
VAGMLAESLREEGALLRGESPQRLS